MITEALAAQIADSMANRLLATLPEAVAKLVAEIMGAQRQPAQLVDINAVAQSFGVSTVTVRRMVDKGMPVEWVASAMRFDLDACHEWRRKRGKGAVTKEAKGKSQRDDEPVPGVTLKSRRR